MTDRQRIKQVLKKLELTSFKEITPTLLNFGFDRLKAQKFIDFLEKQNFANIKHNGDIKWISLEGNPVLLKNLKIGAKLTLEGEKYLHENLTFFEKIKSEWWKLLLVNIPGILIGSLITIIISGSFDKNKDVAGSKTNEVTNDAIELNAKTAKKIEDNSGLEQYMDNDKLLIQLESELEKLALNPRFDLKTQPIINKHYETIIDTIKTLTYDETKIYLYKASDREILYAAKIENSEFKFLDSISIGTKKINFEKRIQKVLESNIIKIGNLEQTSVFIFKFENDKLKAIDYEGYVD
jgi:hypothetical protein